MNYNLGFIRIEVDNKNTEYATDISPAFTYGIFKPLKDIIKINNEKYIFNNTNPYCAFWIYDKKEFSRFVNSKYYDMNNISNEYGVAEKVGVGLHGKHTNWYKGTIIPLKNNKLHESCKIYHLPNNYVNRLILFKDIIQLIKIFYGVEDNNIDITQISYEKCIKENILYIPSSDFKRAAIFGDPLINVLKSIFIKNEDDILVEYDHNKEIYIDIDKNEIFTDNIPEYIRNIYPNVKEKLENIHRNLKLDFGSFNDEFPEQMMSTRYLTGNEKVLEIGGNIGRNSLVIAYILNKKGNNNFVSLECDENIAKQLQHNKELNNLDFGA